MKPKPILALLAGGTALAGASADQPIITAVSVILVAIAAVLDRDQDGVPDFIEKWRRKRRKRKLDARKKDLEDRVRKHTTISTMVK